MINTQSGYRRTQAPARRPGGLQSARPLTQRRRRFSGTTTLELSFQASVDALRLQLAPEKCNSVKAGADVHGEPSPFETARLT